MAEVIAKCTKCGKEFSYCVMVETSRRRSLCEDCKKKRQKYGKDFLVVTEVQKKRGFEGLWAGRSAWYRSKAFNKKDIAMLLAGEKEKKCIIMRHNKFHKKGDNKPAFIFAFVDAKDCSKVVEELPVYEIEDDEEMEYEEDNDRFQNINGVEMIVPK